MWPFDGLGGFLGGNLQEMIGGWFDGLMRGIWDSVLNILRGVFTVADMFSTLPVDEHAGPVSSLWPLMLWISGALAIGLFFWQLTVTTVRGGRGFLRLVVGPAQYGVALAVTIGAVGAFLVAADGLTQGILQAGLRAENFTEAFEHTNFAEGAVDGVRGVVLGIVGIGALAPAAIGFLLEMVFRQAAIYGLVAAIPIVAAGLLANVTSRWFWRTVRWLLACILMKPVLALTLVIGIAIIGEADGLTGLLAGVGVLFISMLCPFVLFRLFAFVDPNTDPGAGFRDALAERGMHSYGDNNPAFLAGRAIERLGSGGSGDIEDANTARFDNATDDDTDLDDDPSMDDLEGPAASAAGGGAGADTAAGGDGTGGAAAEPTPLNKGRVTSSSRFTGPTGDYSYSSHYMPGEAAEADDTDPAGTEPPGAGGPPTPPPDSTGGSDPATPADDADPPDDEKKE